MADAYETLLQTAWGMVSRPAAPWWMQSQWVAAVLDPGTFLRPAVGPSLRAPPMPMEREGRDVITTERAILLTGSNIVKARARLSSVKWPQAETVSRSKALEKWRLIVSADPTASEMGRQVLVELLAGDDVRAADVISDTMAPKATKTLQKRGNSMLAFMAWSRGKGLAPFPLMETTVYTYLAFLKEKAPTAPRAFLEAVAFSLGMVGLSGAQDCISSKRLHCRGFPAVPRFSNVRGGKPVF